MYQGNWARALLSRAAAAAVLCLALAWLAGKIGEAELAETSKMSHQELKEYIRQGASAPFSECYLTVLIFGGVCLALVEAMAGSLRAVLPAPRRPTEVEPPARPVYAGRI